MKEQHEALRVLVGDDQIGVVGSFPQKMFLRRYGAIADFDFESDPQTFVARARSGGYDALLIDLHWKPEDYGACSIKTGYSVMQQSKGYSPIRILHSSADAEEREIALSYGATDTLEKSLDSEHMLVKLKGDNMQ